MDSYDSIKSTIFGGFDKQQVDEYLDELQSEYENAATNPELLQARKKLNQLKTELQKKEARLRELQSTAGTLNNNKNTDEPEKVHFNTLTDSAKRFLNAHNEVLRIASETGDYVKSAEQKLPEMFDRLASISESIDSVSNELNKISEQCDEIYTPVTEKPQKTRSTDEAFPDIPNNIFFDALQSDIN